MADNGGKASNGPHHHPKDEAYLSTIIPKRISMFESIKAQQDIARLSISGEPIKITLPDGSVKEGKKWTTTPLDIAGQISKSSASSAIITEVNDVTWDMARPLEGDCHLKLFKFEDDIGRDTFWHSSAHILGQALEMEYGCKLCIGPCTTRGEEKQPFERIEVTRQQALEMFSNNRFKVEIINDLPEDKTITVYRCGPLVDLCRGPHIPNTAFVKAFSCLKASSAYWRGDKNRESLQRVYGISYPDSKRLKEYFKRLEEAKKYDHRLLGVKQELFFCHPLSPGSWFFLPLGARIYNKLMDFIRSEYRNRGYEEVIRPNIYNMQLWETSGHAANYKENMFVFENFRSALLILGYCTEMRLVVHLLD